MSQSPAPRHLGSSYIMESRIGAGAQGEVWRGRRADAREVLAFKVLRADLVENPDVVERFIKERSTLMRVRSPYVVAIRDVVIEGSTFAIVMDYVNGGDLRDLLRARGSRPLHRWRPWAHVSRRDCPRFTGPGSFTGTSSPPMSCSAHVRAEAAIRLRRLLPVSLQEGACRRLSSLDWRTSVWRASVTPSPPPTSPGRSVPRCTWLRRFCRCRLRPLPRTSTHWASCSTR